MSIFEVGFFSVCNLPAYKILCNNRDRYVTLFELYHVVEFYPLSKFYFILFHNHYHKLPYPKLKKKKKIKPRIKLNQNIYTTSKHFKSCGNLIFLINNWDSNCLCDDYFVLLMLQPYTRKLLPFWVTAVVKLFMQENAFTL